MPPIEEYQFTHSGDKTTFYHAGGPKNGPLLVFIHGWPAIGKLWKRHILVFASLGFRVVAPDMPGYGKSSATKNKDDYTQENINLAMVALLEQQDRDKAVWIGHDWGCGAVWSFAAHYPEKCVAVCGMTVPYRVLELGLEELLKYVDRDLYPEHKYPYGQWSYQRFYETNFDDAHRWFEKDVASFIRPVYSNGNPASYGTVAFTAQVHEQGGWFNGAEQPPPEGKNIPIEQTVFRNPVLGEDMFNEIVASMERTGFFGADAWYANHEANRRYAFEKWKNGGHLHMPVLFIHARFDNVCSTMTTRLADPMREHCTNLTEAVIDAGHWVAEEKPEEVDAVLTRWLVESVKEYWPGYWKNSQVKNMRAAKLI